MRTSRWVLASFVTVVVALAAGTWWLSGRDDADMVSVRPGGELAPFLPGALGPWSEIGRIPAEALAGDGPIVALDVGGDAVFLAQYHHWYRLGPEGLSGSFGDRTRGAPEWIERAEDIAWHDGHVYVLDAGRRQISIWTKDGERQSELPLEEDGTTAYEPTRLIVDGSGRMFVVAHITRVLSGAPGAWVVLRIGEAGSPPDTIWRDTTGMRRAIAANMPLLDIREEGLGLIATALDYQLLWLDRDGAVVRSVTRNDPPLWAAPSDVLEEHEWWLMQLPMQMREAYELPPYVPPVNGVALLADGTVIAHTARDYEMSYLEWLDHDGTPLGRLTESPLFEPILVTDSAVYRVREDVGGVVVEAATLTLR